MMTTNADRLDLRELADEWQALLLTALGDELHEGHDRYVALCNELDIEPTPDSLREQGDGYEPTLIREDAFVEYAQELAEDIGAVPEPGISPWPLYCIDWERAARDLRHDYSSVSFDGHDWLVRSS